MTKYPPGEQGKSTLILGSIQTTPEEFQTAALFLRLGVPTTLIRHEIGAFRKRSSKKRNLKTPAFRFRVDVKHFENGNFRKHCRHDNHGRRSFPQTLIQNDLRLLRFKIRPL